MTSTIKLDEQTLVLIREAAIAAAIAAVQQQQTLVPQEVVLEDVTGRLHDPETGRFLPKAEAPKAKAAPKGRKVTKGHAVTKKSLCDVKGAAITRKNLQRAKRALYRDDSLTAAQHALVVEASTKGLIEAIVKGQIPLPKGFRVGEGYYELVSKS